MSIIPFEQISNPFSNINFWKAIADKDFEFTLQQSELEFIQDLLSSETLVEEEEVLAYAEFHRELLISTLENESQTYKKFRQSFFLFDETDRSELLELFESFHCTDSLQQLPYDHRTQSKLFFIKQEHADVQNEVFTGKSYKLVYEEGYELKEFLAECYQLGLINRSQLPLAWSIVQGETHKLAQLPNSIWKIFHPRGILIDLFTVFGSDSSPDLSEIPEGNHAQKTPLLNNSSLYRLDIPVYMRLSENILTKH
ncbi:MAG: hypothetical protein COB04_18875 [Gammaproteobacteria bacterium]|nr:MAG: hypothetical protein COB04_18875 [Gammaproteobacteria bacterium]